MHGVASRLWYFVEVPEKSQSLVNRDPNYCNRRYEIIWSRARGWTERYMRAEKTNFSRAFYVSLTVPTNKRRQSSPPVPSVGRNRRFPISTAPGRSECTDWGVWSVEADWRVDST